MTLNFIQISNMLQACNELKNTKMPFKLSIILAKNISALEAEQNFFIEREREFALKYLEIDEETQQFKQISEGVFQIKEGLNDECMEARNELNNFTVDINLRKIPVSLVENMDFTPVQLSALEMLLEEEE